MKTVVPGESKNVSDPLMPGRTVRDENAAT